MAIKNKKNYPEAIKRRRSKTIIGSLFRGAGTIFNASAYTWMGDKLDQLILGDQDKKQRQLEDQKEEDQKTKTTQEFQQATGVLKREIAGLQTNISNMNKLQESMMGVIGSLIKDVSFIKDRVSVTFFQVKDLSGELKDVMYDPLGPAGGQFRRATEKGTLTSKLPEELEEKVISKVASFTLKQYKEQQDKKMEIIEYKIDKISGDTDPTKFIDPTEDLGAVDPLERLRREMNEGFEKILDALKEMQGRGGLSDNTGLLGLLGLANIKTLKNILKFLGRTGLVGLAGIIGYQIGKYLNEKLNLSERINDGIERLKDFLGESEAEKEKLAEQQYAQFYREYQNKLLAGTDYMRQPDGSFMNVRTREVFKFGKDIPDATVRNLLESARGLQTRKEFDTNQDGTLDQTELAAALEKIQKMTPAEIQSDIKSKALREAGVSTFLREKRTSGEFPEQYQEPFLDYLDARYEITGNYPSGADLQKEMTDFLGGYFVDQPKAYTERRVEELKAEKETGRIEYEKRMALKRANVADYKTAPLEKYQFEEITETIPDATDPRRSVMKRTYRIKQETPPETEMSDFDRIKQGVIKLESKGNYNAVFGDTSGETQSFSPLKREKKMLTDMTIDEVEKYQGDARVDRDTTRAVGKYQFMRTTLFGTKENPGLIDQYNEANPEDKIKRTDKFTPEVQDKLYDVYFQTNLDVLEEKGVPITPANLYMAHYIGPTGAKIVHDEYTKNPKSEKTVYQLLKDNDISLGDANPELKKTKVPDFVRSIDQRMAGAMPAKTTVLGPKSTTDNDLGRSAPINAEEEAALYGTEGVRSLVEDLGGGSQSIKPDQSNNADNLIIEQAPPPPPPNTADAQSTSDTADGKQALNYIDARRNTFVDNGGNQPDLGIANPRPSDTSFGRNRMRDENLPWSMPA